MAVSRHNNSAFRPLQPQGDTGVFCPPLWRTAQRWRGTRAPRWCHTARAVFFGEDRVFVSMLLASSDKRILCFPANPNIPRPRFREESPKSEIGTIRIPRPVLRSPLGTEGGSEIGTIRNLPAGRQVESPPPFALFYILRADPKPLPGRCPAVKLGFTIVNCGMRKVKAPEAGDRSSVLGPCTRS